jgi:uncharacterized protein YndB with AHSA1/START domain
MTVIDTTAPAQGESISFDFDLCHPPEKVWRALTDPALLAEWLLPVIGLELQPGAAFTFKTQAYPGWDGTVNCRFVEIETHRKLSYTWSVPFLDTVVTASGLGDLLAAAPARPAPVHRPVPVRAAVCHPVARRATHRLTGQPATTKRRIAHT